MMVVMVQKTVVVMMVVFVVMLDLPHHIMAGEWEALYEYEIMNEALRVKREAAGLHVYWSCSPLRTIQVPFHKTGLKITFSLPKNGQYLH